jgi:UDP-N-acetylglucosamine 2-epimerase
MKARLLVAFGTRPECIKLLPVIERFHALGLGAQLLVVNTGQHKDLLDDPLRRYPHVPMLSLEDTYGLPDPHQRQRIVRSLEERIQWTPSLTHALVQGDTDSALASAIAAARCGLHLSHLEAGLRSHDLSDPFPEELNRSAITALATHHFAPTQHARQELEREGVPAERITVTGNTSMDVLRKVRSSRFYKGQAAERDVVLITLHRNENREAMAERLVKVCAHLLKEHLELRVIWVLHPNATGRPERWPDHERFSTSPPLCVEDFHSLISRSAVIITDSGGVQEEATASGIPLVVFRQRHERPESFGAGMPALCSVDPPSILSFVRQFKGHVPIPTACFGFGRTAERVVDWFRVELGEERFDTVIVGGGPAGTGPLLHALKKGTLDTILGRGLAIVERTDHLVRGTLADFRVNSDTLADVFLECLEDDAGKALDAATLAQATRPIRERSGRSILLSEIDCYLQELGQRLEALIDEHPNCLVGKGHSVTSIDRTSEGDWLVRVKGSAQPMRASTVIIATGGEHRTEVRRTDHDSPGDGPFTASSEQLLKGDLDKQLDEILSRDPHVLVLGAGHSGFSSAWYLLHHFGHRFIRNNAVRVLGSEKPRIFYPDVASAIRQGYSDHGPSDVCPVTGRLHRLGGLRMDGRDLYLRMLGLVHPAESRVVFQQCPRWGPGEPIDSSAYDLVIDATGYRFRMVPLFDHDGREIDLLGERTMHWVDERCRVLDEEGVPVPGIFAVGLGAGFIPGGELGGEPGFTGQTNGLWYYQNAVGSLLCDAIHHADTAPVP